MKVNEAVDEALDEALIDAMSRAARQDADLDVEARGGPSPAAWHRLQAARGPARAPRARWRWPLLAGAALSCGLGWWSLRRPAPLTYVVDGAEVEANGYVRASGAAATELRFSDGTRVHLARGTRLAIGAPGPHGARLRLEDGEARFEVRHLPGAEWSVEAGPYRVAVTGTVFDVSWAGAQETAIVTMHAGSVVVTGPQIAAPIRLTGDQRLTARVAAAELRIDRRPDANGSPIPATPVAAPLPPTPAEPPAPPAANLSPPPRRPADGERAVGPRLHARRWASEVAEGQSAAVLAEARAYGVDDALASVDADALAALADAARYTGTPALSTRALEELRHRFPASPRAGAAAFLLGRLADDAGGTGAALDWYRRYLAETPRGPYAAEALGREMLGIERLSGRAAAASIARDYVRLFPDGTYLLQARAILGLP